MARTSRKVRTATASVVSGEGAADAEVSSFNQQLEDEKQEKAEGLAKFKDVKKEMKDDSFTNVLKSVFGLKGNPAFKTDFTDPRWPRVNKGQLLTVTRAYYPAIEGPRKESLEIRSLGERETEQIRVILDRVEKGLTQEEILAKKWACESSGYRYFWIQEGENFELDLEDPKNVFFERFATLKEKPAFTFGPLTNPPRVESEIYGTDY